NALPDPVAELCAALGATDGVVAITLGGSRAAGTADQNSDWAVGLYYRGMINLTRLARYGTVHPPGSWVRTRSGGAWLALGGAKGEGRLRALAAGLFGTARARLGVYEIDALLGYLAGAPTYSLMAELALNRTVHGLLPAMGEYPEALAEAGARRWPLHADFSLAHAQMRAARGDAVGAVGHGAKAVIETSPALACRARRWVLNEKQLIERVGLQDLHARFVPVPTTPRELVAWVDELRAALGRTAS